MDSIEAWTTLPLGSRNNEISDMYFYIKNHLPVIKIPKPQSINYLGKRKDLKHKKPEDSSRNLAFLRGVKTHIIPREISKTQIKGMIEIQVKKVSLDFITGGIIF